MVIIGQLSKDYDDGIACFEPFVQTGYFCTDISAASGMGIFGIDQRVRMWVPESVLELISIRKFWTLWRS